MSDVEDAEVVQCGSKVVSRRMSESYYTDLLTALTKNCIVSKDTITFAKEDWESTKGLIKQIEAKVVEMSQLTPVTGAAGLCKATTCQWEQLGKMRAKANRDSSKVERMYIMVEHVVSIVDNLIAEKVVAVDEWWKTKAGQIRSEIDNMKRE